MLKQLLHSYRQKHNAQRLFDKKVEAI